MRPSARRRLFDRSTAVRSVLPSSTTISSCLNREPSNAAITSETVLSNPCSSIEGGNYY
jgi:hypothetical protein